MHCSGCAAIKSSLPSLYQAPRGLDAEGGRGHAPQPELEHTLGSHSAQSVPMDVLKSGEGVGGGDVVVLRAPSFLALRLGCSKSCCRAANQRRGLTQRLCCTSENFSRAQVLFLLPQEPRYRRNAPPGMRWWNDGPAAGVMSVVTGDEVPRGKARS